MFKRDSAEGQSNRPEWHEIVPENFRRDTLEESFQVLLKSYNEAYRKISAQGAETRELRKEAQVLRAHASNLEAELQEHRKRDETVALLSALAATEGGF